MNILFLCSSGASTSLIVNLLEKEAQMQKRDWKFKALPITEVEQSIGKYDLIFVAPQIRYQKSIIISLTRLFNIKILDLDPIMYGQCDISGIVKIIKRNQVDGEQNE